MIRVKSRWFVGITILLLVIGSFVWYYRGTSTLDEASLLAAEKEIRNVVSEYTIAMKTADVETLADLVTYPVDMGGALMTARAGFVSQISHAFRAHLDPIHDLAYVITNIDIEDDQAIVDLIETVILVGYFGQLVELEKTVYITFDKVGNAWKIAHSGRAQKIETTILMRIADSALTIPIILLGILFSLGYIGSKTSF